jgi:hypothetical protein
VIRFRWSILVVLLAGSCRTPPNDREQGAYLDVRWTGSARGKLSGPATALWCSPRRLLEIRTVQGDTGIALALYPGETIAAGRYRVVDPAKAESLPPAAAVALRWLTQSTVQGFQADSGAVELERSGAGVLSGRVRIRARSVVDTQKVSVNGAFERLTAAAGGPECAAAESISVEDAEPPDTGVH